MTAAARARVVLALVATCALATPACKHKVAPKAPPRGTIAHLEKDRMAPGAYGRAGDIVFENEPFGVLTFASGEATPGHRPLRGALVDVGVHDGGDVSDPIVTWRVGWRGADGAGHFGPTGPIGEMDCPHGRGLLLRGVVDAVDLETSVCPSSFGFTAASTARGLPDGAALADEVYAGTSHVIVQGAGARIDGDTESPYFGVTNDSVGWLLESTQMRVIGKVAHIGEQVFQGPFVLQYVGARANRNFRVVRGDAFDLLHEVPLSAELLRVALAGDDGKGVAGQIALLDGQGRGLALGALPAAGRYISVPSGVGSELDVIDPSGIVAERAHLTPTLHAVSAKAPARAELALHYTDAHGAPLAVHVILHGLDGQRDPSPNVAPDPHVYAAGRSLYLVDGSATVALPPGHYRVTATHGIRYSLATNEVTLEAGKPTSVAASLHDALGPVAAAWTSADFHLHAEPSPDAPVPLDARVAALVCEGLDLAVATDHNRVTDYGPVAERLGVGARIVTVPGDEITSYGPKLWGHFNLYPLAPAAGAPEEAASPYFDLTPDKIFAAAHGEGPLREERILQVNHPRMEPSIGYFDLTHLDPKTGHADAAFSADFDAVEAFNGFWMTNAAKVRQGALDLVTLARRGMRVAATGNSDSHHLLYEEAGYPRTYVHVPPDPIATRRERLLAAVRRHDTTVSSGPLVEMTVDGAPIGSVVTPKGGSVRVHVRVSAAAWVPVEHVEVWHDDEVAFHVDVTKAPADGVRYEGDIRLEFPVDGTILAWATADTPLPDVLPYATARATGFTGLVYVDANGDGKVEVPPAK